MRLTDPTLYKSLFFNPELAAGEAYMDGRMSFENSTLRDFLTLFSVNRLSLGSYPLQKVLRKVSRGLKRFQQANPVGKAQQNVAHHYDIGNDFYRLFLDKGMQYSCAYFTSDDDTLEEAQQNKLRLIASKLNLKPGQSVLDIGSRLGRHGALSGAHGERRRPRRDAVEGAVRACKREGASSSALADRVRFELQDYRKVTETFDRIVSVGMFEHVGVAPLRRVLRQGERAHDRRRRHAAAFDRPHEPARHGVARGCGSTSFQAPTRRRCRRCSPRSSRTASGSRTSSSCASITRRRSRTGTSASRPTAPRSPRMYDERFCRMWEFYLISAEMMFRTGSQLVFHMQLAKKRDAAPIVRDYITDTQRQYLALERERLAAAPK